MLPKYHAASTKEKICPICEKAIAESSASWSGGKKLWTLVAQGCVKLLLPECLYHLPSFDVLSVVSVLKRRFRFLELCRRSSVSELESKTLL